jgi:type II secretory pathway component PulK
MRPAETGYALVTAVVAMAVLAMISLTLLQSASGTMAGASAENARARLVAATQAGTAMAIHGLGSDDPLRRWPIDGRVRKLAFDTFELRIAVEDDRGKIPINALAAAQVRTMFALLGANGGQLDQLVDSFLDWRDADSDVRPLGAEAGFYAARHLVPRNGPLRAVDEMGEIRGLTPAMVEALRHDVTLAIDQDFDPRFATPLALAVFSGGGLQSAEVIQRQRVLAGQSPAIVLNDTETFVARPLTIRVEARSDGGDRYASATRIELTASALRPLLIHGLE